MWTASNEPLSGGRIIKVTINRDMSPVSYAEVLRLWQDDAGFRSFFIKLLADAPFAAFRWETPAVSTATSGRCFEFVLLDSPELARRPDVAAFAEHFVGAAKDGVVAFANLGKDAMMVVPCPGGPLDAYTHLGAFVRQAPEPQRHLLWERVGATTERRLGAQPVWLSTAGAGVAWLHVRLDDRPKYFGYADYRRLRS